MYIVLYFTSSNDQYSGNGCITEKWNHCQRQEKGS